MQIYADLLVKNTAKIPGYIDPRNDRRFIWNKLGAHDVNYLKGTCLPLYVDPSYSRETEIIYNKMKALSYDDLRLLLYYKIIATDKENAEKASEMMRGWGLTNESITKEGMTTDDIQKVLKKKTHHIIPVIASNDIPTLLPLVGPTTKEFGFVINS